MGNEWQIPDHNQLCEEWETETMDSLFFSGYPSKDEAQRYREHFMKHVFDFSNIENIESVEGLHTYLTSSVEQLKINIAHMNKDVDYLVEAVLSGKAYMPLLMRKKSLLQVIGGRTRLTIAAMHNKPISALVIDHQKMAQYFRKLREPEYLNIGYAELVFESRKKRVEILRHLKTGSRNLISDEGEIWSELTPSEKQRLLDEISEHLGLPDNRLSVEKATKHIFLTQNESNENAPLPRLRL